MDPEGRIRLVNGEPTINFGRHRGRSLNALSREEPGVLRWILKGDFSRFVKEIVATFLPKEERVPGKAFPVTDPARPTTGSLFPLESDDRDPSRSRSRVSDSTGTRSLAALGMTERGVFARSVTSPGA